MNSAHHQAAADAPDGDADLEHADFSSFKVPACEACGGILKPDVVFFGENVPRETVNAAFALLEEGEALIGMSPADPVLFQENGLTFEADVVHGQISQQCGDGGRFGDGGHQRALAPQNVSDAHDCPSQL